jgi:hypothetical protein
MNATGHATGELVLATLYLAPTEEREAELRRAARVGLDWRAALVALEAHGILGLALRNLEHAGAAVPPDVLPRLLERAAAMRAIELGFRLTLERFLVEAQRAGIEVTLLKGASLALDLYPQPGLRSQGDLDLLVRPEHVLRAVAAARRIGLYLPSRALPAWWYRLAHFHLKLAPADGLQREIELHWHLHPLAQLYTVRLADLLARRTRLELGGAPAWTLDPLDRLLHLVTHVVRHCPLGMLERETLRAWAADPRVPLRLKWLVDVRAEVERRHAEIPPAQLARRAAEWNAEAELALVLAWLRDQLGFAGEARAWVEHALAALQPLSSTRPPSPPAHDRALPGLDLRPSALLAFPRWVWPSSSYFGRLSGNGPVPVARRALHAARVLGRGALVLGATPLAWGASLGRRAFGKGPEHALGAEDLLELTARARQLARAEDGSTSS